MVAVSAVASTAGDGAVRVLHRPVPQTPPITDPAITKTTATAAASFAAFAEEFVAVVLDIKLGNG